MMVRRICATHFGEMCIAVGKEKLYSKLVSLIRRYKNGRLKSPWAYFDPVINESGTIY